MIFSDSVKCVYLLTEHGLFNLIDFQCMEKSHVCMYDYV